MSKNFVRYADSVETIQPGEEQTFDDIAATMRDIAHKIGDRQRHTTRAVHAKSHALLRAEVAVGGGLPEPLRQGLAAGAGRYGATATWELRVQLCTDVEKMPVEDGTVEWDEDQSPYLAVATVTARPQEVYSDARRVFVDELLSFDPWHCLAAHRPLGNLMRARFKAYAMSSKFRRAREGRETVEPRSVGEMPGCSCGARFR